MSLFTGAGVAIITPFKENGDVNYEKFAEIIEEQIAAGTVEIMLSDLGLSPGNYSIVISELEAEKKAEQPLGIHGTWSCTFAIQ